MAVLGVHYVKRRRIDPVWAGAVLFLASDDRIDSAIYEARVPSLWLAEHARERIAAGGRGRSLVGSRLPAPGSDLPGPGVNLGGGRGGPRTW
jgi:hypothetical protein